MYRAETPPSPAAAPPGRPVFKVDAGDRLLPPVEWAVIMQNRRRSFLIWLLLFSIITTIHYRFRYPSGQSTFTERDDLDAPFPVSTGASNSPSDSCDLFTGNWVRDDAGSRYTNRTCRTIPESKNCIKYGKDRDYVNWRWKPEACELPTLDAAEFLTFMRGSIMAFVGDSVSRNQMESLLCLLSQASTPVDVVEDKDEEGRFQTWHFTSHNFTLKALWTKYLVAATERTNNGSATGTYDLNLDDIDANWGNKISGASHIVISGGHWFNRQLYLHEGGMLAGCVYCSDARLKNYSPSSAARAAFRTALRFVSEHGGGRAPVTLLRTFTPSHFEHGMWDSGGYCNRTAPDGSFGGSGEDWELRSAQLEEMERVVAERGGGERFGVVDVTEAMMMRADAHPGPHWNNEWMRGYNDCTHWCMPGPVDVWNDMLFAMLKRRAALLN